jgi:hypothetical protein
MAKMKALTLWQGFPTNCPHLARKPRRAFTASERSRGLPWGPALMPKKTRWFSFQRSIAF